MIDPQAVHRKLFTLDSHVDIPFCFGTPEADPGVRSYWQVSLPKMREGGLDAAFFIAFIDQGPLDAGHYAKARQDAEKKVRAIRNMCLKDYPDQIGLATAPQELEAIHRSGRLAACIGIENGYAIGRDLSLLRHFFDLGVRYMTLAHNGHNDICDSAQPLPALGDPPQAYGGLSPFGRQVITEMNRLGMIVDVSHISRQSMLDAVALSRAPVVASHANVRALCDHPRNLDDEQLLALKDTGGLLQTVALRRFIKPDPLEKIAALQAMEEELGIHPGTSTSERLEKHYGILRERSAPIHQKWPVTVSNLADHIDYAVNLMGIDHVGISSDFDGGGGIEGWDDATETPNLTAELMERGYDPTSLQKLWGGNFRRVWREAMLAGMAS